MDKARFALIQATAALNSLGVYARIEPSVSTQLEQPVTPPQESRQVRRARERAEAKKRRASALSKSNQERK